MTFFNEYFLSVLVFSGTIVTTFFIAWLLRLNRLNRKYPPCLPSIPVFGSLPFLPHFSELHIYFTKKASKMGKVFSLYLGNNYTVVLNGRDIIKEALVKDSVSFAGRPYLYSARFTDPDRNGIILHPYTTRFKKFHKLSLSILKQFGFGQGIMENRVHVEVQEMIDQFSKYEEPFDPSEIITMCVFNVISSIIFGKRFEISDPKMHEMIESVHNLMRISSGPFMTISFFPMLRFFPKYRKALNGFLQYELALKEIIKDRIKKSLSGETEESFISYFVKEEGPNYDYQQLLISMKELYLAGTETTATSLQWLLVLMANHPEIQARLQIEIDGVVRKSTLPSLEDKSRLPYVEATILELMRIRTLVPLAVPHMTTSNTNLGGYFIPANSMVIVNLYSAHMDPDVWKTPEIFSPERFLDASGSVINKDLVIPFSLGKRSCLGEVLARQELFLFTTGLLQQFDIRPPEGHQTIDSRENVGVTNSPSTFKVRLIKRTSNY